MFQVLIAVGRGAEGHAVHFNALGEKQLMGLVAGFSWLLHYAVLDNIDIFICWCSLYK